MTCHVECSVRRGTLHVVRRVIKLAACDVARYTRHIGNGIQLCMSLNRIRRCTRRNIADACDGPRRQFRDSPELHAQGPALVHTCAVSARAHGLPYRRGSTCDCTSGHVVCRASCCVLCNCAVVRVTFAADSRCVASRMRQRTGFHFARDVHGTAKTTRKTTERKLCAHCGPRQA